MGHSDLLGGAASDEKLNLDAVEDFSGWESDDDDDDDAAAVDEEEEAAPFGEDSDEINRSSRDAPPAADEDGTPML